MTLDSLPRLAPSTGEVPWEEFLAFWFDWEQGEHVTLIGPTGGGKTTLALELLPRRDFVLAIATKQRDEVLYRLEDQDCQRVEDFHELPDEAARRIILSVPLARGSESLGEQRKVVHEALVTVYRQGGWTVYLDEVRYITQFLRLGTDMELLWQQGRSSHISVVAGGQRPAFIPLSAYSQATHVFFWRTNDKRDLDRIGGLGGHDSRAIASEVSRLPRHTVLYVNTRTGEKVRTRVGS